MALPEGVHLVLAGRALDAAYAAEVARLASDRVHVVGAVDDVVGLLRASDVFAFASAQEACPVAVIEAMSTGLPVVVSDIAGTQHLVTDGRDGLRFPVGKVDVLGTGLAHLADDPARRRALGEAARRRVVEEFTVEREAAAYEDLYDEVLDGPGRGA